MESKIYTLIGADGKPYQSSTKGALGGHRRDKIYGTLDCKGAKRWIARGHYVKQRVFFADEATAIAAGYRPCFGCMREKYREWKAQNPKSKIQNGKNSPDSNHRRKRPNRRRHERLGQCAYPARR